MPSHAEQRRAAQSIAEDHGGAASRDLLRKADVTRNLICLEVRTGRWQVHGRQTIAVHTSDLGVLADRWRAVWETGSDIAALDGVTALAVAGLTGITEELIHVSVVHRHDLVPVQGVRQHKVIRRLAGEVVASGVPRTEPAIAALRAAHWAVSDRQAALFLIAPVQQRLVTPTRLREVVRLMPGRNRRATIARLVSDLVDGVRALSELDFARLCRASRIPEPARQVVRQLPSGRAYLDVRWDNGLVVEVDGIHHLQGVNPVDDALRQNEVVLTGDGVLRIPLLGLRLQPAVFMRQVELMHALLCARPGPAPWSPPPTPPHPRFEVLAHRIPVR